jgi:hypothetical protein
VLETADERAAKEARTRELLAAYKSKIGLKIDPKLKSECEEVCFYKNIILLTCMFRVCFTYVCNLKRGGGGGGGAFRS